MPEKKTTTTKTKAHATSKKKGAATTRTRTKEGGQSMRDLYTKGTTKKNAANAAAGRPFRESYRVLVRPLITEKAARASVDGTYTFVVDGAANKITVARSVEAVYGVKPTAVRIVRLPGKRVRRGRITGKRAGLKKALVTLPRGTTIQIYEGV